LRPFSKSFVFTGRSGHNDRRNNKRKRQQNMKTQELEHDEVKTTVRERYGKIATSNSGCGCAPTCCSPTETAAPETHDPKAISHGLGYSAADTNAVPEGANLGLGCGNPQAIAALKPGETVLDLGSGAGFDTFLAARAVGPKGFVIGVDMTPEMVSKARKNQATGGYANVEFRIGEIESLPVANEYRGRHHLELRHQSFAGQVARVQGVLSRAEAGRTAGDLGRGRVGRDSHTLAQGLGALHRLCRGGFNDCGNQGVAGSRRDSRRFALSQRKEAARLSANGFRASASKSLSPRRPSKQ
jgi:SAM-dependent methyltransferase